MYFCHLYYTGVAPMNKAPNSENINMRNTLQNKGVTQFLFLFMRNKNDSSE